MVAHAAPSPKPLGCDWPSAFSDLAPLCLFPSVSRASRGRYMYMAGMFVLARRQTLKPLLWLWMDSASLAGRPSWWKQCPPLPDVVLSIPQLPCQEEGSPARPQSLEASAGPDTVDPPALCPFGSASFGHRFKPCTCFSWLGRGPRRQFICQGVPMVIYLSLCSALSL